MKNMRENENKYDVIIDDGGRIYKMEFLAGPMTELEIIADFMDGYDGDISEEDISIAYPEDVAASQGLAALLGI